MVIDLIRPHIRNLTPYSTARDEFKGTARAFLDANENPFESPYNRYPDPRAGQLKDLFASRVGVDSSQVLVTNGSDEAIDLLTRAVVGPEDGVIVTPPTYGMYGVVARALGVKVFFRPVPRLLFPHPPSNFRPVPPITCA